MEIIHLDQGRREVLNALNIQAVIEMITVAAGHEEAPRC